MLRRACYRRCRKHILLIVCGTFVLTVWLCKTDTLLFTHSVYRDVDDFPTQTVRSLKSNTTKLMSKCLSLQKSKAFTEQMKDEFPHTDLLDTFQQESKKRGHVFISRGNRLMYCSIAKVGSSFLLSILKVIDESNSERLRFFDIKGTQVHNTMPNSMMLTNVSKNEFKEIIATYTKFMFVRDPFSRLFSGYVDKILVPTYVGMNAIDIFMRENLIDTQKLACRHKVSFADFCSSLAEALVQEKYYDIHFVPMSTQCSPCLVNYTFIGKMETFLKDTREILQKAGINLSDVAGDVQDIDRINDVGIIRNVIERVWFTSLARSDGCLTHLETADRLWRHLQMRGYISKAIPLPLNQGSNTVFSFDNYTSAAVRAYEQSEPRDVIKRQRKEAMMEGYSLVPRETLDKLARIFAEDCTLFDYSCDVDRFLKHKTLQFYFKGL